MMAGDQEPAIHRAAELLRKARHAVVLTGAGLSTPSGIPDFRSVESGLWTKNDPMKVASLSSFRHTPRAFFDWLRPLARQIALAQPNPAHLALAQLEEAGILKAVLTQNIDGLHQRAGSHTVLELHGTMTTLTCQRCHRTEDSDSYLKPLIEEGTIPLCPACQAILKPDIVLFEEMLPVETWRKAQEHSEQADVYLVAGSSLSVMPAAGLPIYAVETNAAVIINNFTPTFLDERADVLIPLNVAEALPEIARRLL